MLRNRSSDTLVLEWDGKATVLKPGATCRFLADPMIELHFEQKFHGRLEHTPESREANSTVEVKEPGEEASAGGGDLQCDAAGCGYVAKSEAGLAAHKRAKHS